MIEVSKEYLPTMAVGYKDPRVKVHIQDGAEFLLDHKQSFDVIITDSSDCVGVYTAIPAHMLITVNLEIFVVS